MPGKVPPAAAGPGTRQNPARDGEAGGGGARAADCEVSVVPALNGVAVQVQRIDPDTGQEQVRQEVRKDSDPAGM